MNSLDHKISVIKYHYHAFYVIRWLLDQTSVRELPIYKTRIYLFIEYTTAACNNLMARVRKLSCFCCLSVQALFYIEESVIGSIAVFLLILKSQGPFFFY